MTCIVGLSDKGRVWMGGDSAGVAGLSITIRADPKVFINGPFIIGFTSSFRMGQLLMFDFIPPTHPQDMNNYQYMVTLVVPSIRSCFKDGGFAQSNNSQEKGGQFLIGYNGILYHIGADYQVGIPIETYTAVGCGEDIALGSMYTSQGRKPEYRIKTAILAAEKFNGGVRSPILVLKK